MASSKATEAVRLHPRLAVHETERAKDDVARQGFLLQSVPQRQVVFVCGTGHEEERIQALIWADLGVRREVCVGLV